MDSIQVIARLTIHPGILEEFKQLAARCMQSVRERESGTLQYDWFFNDTRTECVVRETYKDSGAVYRHVASLGTTLAQIHGVCDMARELYGSPSPDLVKAAAGLAPKIYSPYQSS